MGVGHCMGGGGFLVRVRRPSGESWLNTALCHALHPMSSGPLIGASFQIAPATRCLSITGVSSQDVPATFRVLKG